MTIDAVQIGRNSSSSNAVTTTGGTSTGGANSTFVLMVSHDPGAAVTSVSDNKGNSYSMVREGGYGTPSLQRVTVYECVGGVGGAGHTCTVNFDATAYPAAHFIEVTGAAASSPRDISVYSAPYNNPNPSAVVNTGALAQAAEVVLAIIATGAAGSPSYSEVSAYSFTKLSEETDGDNYWTSAVFKKVTASTSSMATQWTDGAAEAQYSIAFVSYKEGAGGGPPPTSMPPPRSQAQRIAPLLGF